MRRVITTIICMLLLFGCQPTPMESAVVQKDGSLEKTIEAPPLLEYFFPHPDYIGESIQLSDKTKLTFETNIILEGISSFPVYRIKYLPFSTSEINSLLSVLFGNERVVQKSQVRSKGVIEQEIRYWEELRTKTLSGEEEGDLKTYESMLNTLYKEWNDATEDPAYPAYDGEWKEQSLSLASETSDKTLEVWNNEALHSSRLYYSNGDDYYSTGTVFEQSKDSSLTPTEAMNMAEQWIQQIEPLKNCRARFSKKGRRYQNEREDGYVVVFEREYDNLSKAYLSNYENIGGEGSSSINDIPDFSQIYYGEIIQVSVNKDGITSLLWENQMETSVINPNVMLLSFDQALNRLKAGIKSKYAWVDQANAERKVDSVNIYVDELRLCLVTIPERGHMGEYVLVPSWICFGVEEYHHGNEIEKVLYKDSCIVAINAIDGTIIC